MIAARRYLGGRHYMPPGVHDLWGVEPVRRAVEDVFAMRGLWVDLGEEPPAGWPGRVA